MKPIYKDKTIVQRIVEIRHEALLRRRELLYIELSLSESLALLREIEPCSNWWYPSPSTLFEEWLYVEGFCQRHRQEHKEPQPVVKVLGIDIKVSR
jgi:hypothetical protein